MEMNEPLTDGFKWKSLSICVPGHQATRVVAMGQAAKPRAEAVRRQLLPGLKVISAVTHGKQHS